MKKYFKNIRIIVFGLFLITYYLLLITPTANAALLYTGSATQIVYKGDTFVVDWYLDTERISLNTVDLKILFTKENLKVVDVSSGNSLLSLWIKQPVFDNNNGTIELTGGAPNGFNDSDFPIFRTTFEAINTGNAKINLDEKSLILRNDGFGTSEVLKFKPMEFPIAEFSLKPSTIFSNSHPDQSAWYRQNDVLIYFEAKPGTDYSYEFSSNSEVFPDDTADKLQEGYEYKDLPDGIYYFKVNSKIGPSPWQEAGVYRVQIDTTPPDEFNVEIGSDTSIYEGDKFLSFSTVDKMSGISHYKVKFGPMSKWKIAKSPYKLQKPIFGNEIKVLSADNAGNERIVTINYKSLIPNWIWVIFLILAALLIVFYVWKQFKKTKNETNEPKI